MPTYVFKALYTASKVGVAPASAPTVDVCNGAGTLVVTGGSATAMTGITGLYSYSYTGAADEYVAVFKTTTTTVDLQHIPSWTPTVLYTQLDAPVSGVPAAVRTNLATELGRLDATVSSRNATTPPSAAAVADAVWDELIAGHVVPLSTGALLATAGAAADPLLNAVPGAYPTGSAGWRLGTYGTGSVTIVSPVATGNVITLIYGDDYLTADGRSLSFTGTNWPTLTAGSVALIVQAATVITIAGTVTGAAACVVELTHTQVESIGVNMCDYDLQATLANGHVVTLAQSTLVVAKDVR